VHPTIGFVRFCPETVTQSRALAVQRIHSAPQKHVGTLWGAHGSSGDLMATMKGVHS
jgi:hypothetical protein